MLPHSVKFIILAPLAGKKMTHASAAAIQHVNLILLYERSFQLLEK